MSNIEKGWYKRNNGSNALIEVVDEHESGDLLCRWAFDNGKSFRYHPFEFKNEFEPVTQEYVDGIERHCCPDHSGMPQVFAYSVNKDENPNPDRWDVDQFGVRDCSYCGSIHPDDFIKLIREFGFGIIEPSTKSYKLYVNVGVGRRYKYYRSHDEEHDFVNKYNQIIDEKKLLNIQETNIQKR